MPSFSFPSDQLILLPCFLFCLSQVHSGLKPIYFLFRYFLWFCLEFPFFALNCAVFLCVTSVFCIFDVISLSRLYIQYGKIQRKKYNTKNNPNPRPNSNPNHCYSSLLLPGIKLFWLFDKIQLKIQHA